MSTTLNDTWQSNRASDLSRSEAALISAHWSEVTAHLVPPGIAWQWGECAISHKVKCNWEDDRLIRRAPDGRRWVTTEALWCHVIDRAADDEVVGVDARGQQVLDAPSQSESSRVLAPKNRSLGRAVQATLTGDTTDPPAGLDWDGVRENQMKDPTRKSDRELAAEHPAQSRLQTFAHYARDAWDVNVPWFRDPVRVPTGNVY